MDNSAPGKRDEYYRAVDKLLSLRKKMGAVNSSMKIQTNTVLQERRNNKTGRQRDTMHAVKEAQLLGLLKRERKTRPT